MYMAFQNVKKAVGGNNEKHAPVFLMFEWMIAMAVDIPDPSQPIDAPLPSFFAIPKELAAMVRRRADSVVHIHRSPGLVTSNWDVSSNPGAVTRTGTFPH